MRSRDRSRAVAVAVAAWLLGGCARPALVVQGPALRLRLAVLDDGAGQRLRVDDVDSPPFRRVRVDLLRFSADGEHYAVPVELAGGGEAVLRDGRLGPTLAAIIDLALSPLGDHLATVIGHGERVAVDLDGRVGPPLDSIAARTLGYTRSGHAVWVGGRGRASHLFVDGVAGPPWDGVGGLIESPAGRLAYLARRGRTGQLVLVDEGHLTLPPQEAIAEAALGPAGAVALLAREHGLWYALRVDSPAVAGAPTWRSPPCESASDLAFGDDGRLSFIARRRGQQLLIADDVPQAPFDEVVRGSLVRRAGHIAYIARRGARSAVVIDGAIADWHPAVVALALSADGRRAAWLARDEPRTTLTLFVDGAAAASYSRADSLQIADDGRVALVVREPGHDHVASGRAIHRFDAVIEQSLILSHDGAHFACIAADADRREFFVSVDGRSRYPLVAGQLARTLERPLGELLPDLGAPLDRPRALAAAVLVRHLRGRSP